MKKINLISLHPEYPGTSSITVAIFEDGRVALYKWPRKDPSTYTGLYDSKIREFKDAGATQIITSDEEVVIENGYFQGAVIDVSDNDFSKLNLDDDEEEDTEEDAE